MDSQQPNYSRPNPYGNPSPEPSASDPLNTDGSDHSRQGSFMEGSADLDHRKYQGLSAGGVPGYQAVQDHSEPGSPVLEGAYERSHESGSSGTKVDQGSSSRLPRPDTMSSESSFDNRASSYNQHPSAQFYNAGQNNSSTGYIDAGLYHPSSPSQSPYGRTRAGSFGNGSGLDSARASTVGTDHMAAPGYNGSRVALNNEWRTSTDQTAIAEVAPGKEIYGDAAPAKRSAFHDMTMSEKLQDDLKYTPLAIGPGAHGEKKAPPPGGEKVIVAQRTNRLEWIDGLRGIASIIIFTHHFSDLTWGQLYPGVMPEGSLSGFFRDGQLAVGMYFLVGGRVLAASFLKSAFTPPKAKEGEDAEKTKIATKTTASPRWLTLSSSLFRRSIRLAFPAIVVGFIQWQVCVTGLTTGAPEAAHDAVLDPSALWVPSWCEIGDFAGFLRFCVDLFTERNHQYMLMVGSALWTTYDQFWGSVFVYIIAATFAPIPIRGRYTLYLCVAVALWWVNSPNLLYLIGLFMADLYASGIVRKVQDHWKPTLAIEIVAAIIALMLITGGEKIATPGDHALGSITVYDGKYGWNPQFTWPQYMFLSNWVPPTMILIWVEFSHAMQWAMSWRILRWIGKVSYGFYLMQFLILYGLMPHLVLYFNDQGRNFWDIIVPTYIICLLTLFFVSWISYHLLDRIGLKLGKYVWDGFFVTKPNTAGAWPLKVVRSTWELCVNGPGRFVKSTSTNSVNKYRNARRIIWTIFNWRSPVPIRPAVSDPNDPEVLSQLHSTSWNADMSNDIEAMRVRKLLNWQQYAWVPHIFIIPGFTALWTIFHPTGEWTYDALTWSTIWRFFWLMSVPNCCFAFMGFLTPDRLPKTEGTNTSPVHREYIRNFFIVLVTKGSNETAVRRGYNKLIGLEKYHPAVKVVVLTDEPYVYPDLQNIVCPKSYKSPLGKAKYKARALDYFRYHVSLGVYDWILHMDEESVTDGETLRNCLYFVRHTPHHFGQGIIMYNGEGYWDNWYFTVADGLRVGDDVARFHFANSVIGRPVFGVHGSFLLTNGEMENECTWDFGSLAEDFEFSQDAWRRGFTCGRVHGIVREQSPTTVRDFLKQRRRWFMGIRDIDGMYGLPHLAVNLWIVGVFTLAVTILNIPLGFIDYSITPLWVAICANYSFVTYFTLYIWGLLVQELDYAQPWWKICIHLPTSIIIIPFAAVSEGLAAIWAMSSIDFGKFEVIVKR